MAVLAIGKYIIHIYYLLTIYNTEAVFNTIAAVKFGNNNLFRHEYKLTNSLKESEHLFSEKCAAYLTLLFSYIVWNNCSISLISSSCLPSKRARG